MTTSPSRLDDEGARNDARPLVEVRGISKRFGGVQALDDVSVVDPGRAASTASSARTAPGSRRCPKVIGGVYPPDDGELLVDGRHVTFHAPRDALDAGIATIAQEIALVPARTVVENVMLGIESSYGGRRPLGRGAPSLRRAERADGLRPRPPGGRPHAPHRRAAEGRDPPRDRPRRPAAPDGRADRRAHPRRDRAAARHGPGSGRRAGLRSFSSRTTSRRCLASATRSPRCGTGVSIRTSPAAQETPETLVAAMIGRDMSLEFPPKEYPAEDAPVVLEARGMSRGRELQDVSLTVGRARSSGSPGSSGAAAPRWRGRSSAPTTSTRARSSSRVRRSR